MSKSAVAPGRMASVRGQVGAHWIMTHRPETQDAANHPTRRDEGIAFFLLAFVLFPVLSIILVGGFGFVLWMSHLMFGPPGAH